MNLKIFFFHLQRFKIKKPFSEYMILIIQALNIAFEIKMHTGKMTLSSENSVSIQCLNNFKRLPYIPRFLNTNGTF